MTEPDAIELLNRAAAALSDVAYSSPFTTSPGVRLNCLWAVELLRSFGVVPTRSPDVVVDPQTHIGDALALLGMLPLRVFGQHAVLEAAAAARDALDATR